jgi:hypothetical protein
VLGFAVPFYLAHPRLMRLERAQMFECERAGEADCRRILRHEAGHALEEAYGFNHRPRYRQLFGDPRQPYPDNYKRRVDSRDHVINLVGWYAQDHPVEDFAETFAVWLNRYTDWRASYKNWPALEKLAYVYDANLLTPASDATTGRQSPRPPTQSCGRPRGARRPRRRSRSGPP